LAQTSIYYLITVYMLSYLIAQRGDDSAGVIAVMIASAVSLFSGPAWGWLSDKVGRRPVTVFGCVATAVFGWIFFAYLDAGPLVFSPVIVIIGMSLAHDAVDGPPAGWFAGQFPLAVRYSGVNMGYQIGTVIGGGIMPMIATLLYAAGG